MTDYESSRQEASGSNDERRAAWERFTMVVLGGDGGGYVNVRNDSHDDDSNHTYSVYVTDGHTDGCSCPHALYRDAHCKHQVAVEDRPIVLASATAANAQTHRVAADGGTVAHEE